MEIMEAIPVVIVATCHSEEANSVVEGSKTTEAKCEERLCSEDETPA